jgi:hypothetical protein
MCRLSLAWGKSQTEIEQTVSARDLDEMLRFYRQEPWGSERDNIHAGLIASTFANAFRGKGQKAVTFQDFMLTDRETHRKRETQKTLSWFKAVAKKKKKKNGN